MPVLMRRLHLHMLSWGHPSSSAGPQPQPRSNSAKHRAVAHIQLLGLPGVDVVVVAAQLDQQVGWEGGEAGALGGLQKGVEKGAGEGTRDCTARQGRWGTSNTAKQVGNKAQPVGLMAKLPSAAAHRHTLAGHSRPVVMHAQPSTCLASNRPACHACRNSPPPSCRPPPSGSRPQWCRRPSPPGMQRRAPGGAPSPPHRPERELQGR